MPGSPRDTDPGPSRSRRFGGARVELTAGHITRVDLDAIVNAANSSLMGGGGVDGAIHRAGGPAILRDCTRIVAERGPLPPGQAVATSAGDLPCRRVIHTVGPVWRGGAEGESATLASCYRSSLELAAREGLRSIAFPSISTGAYGYPVSQAAGVALGAVREALLAGSRLERVRFVLFSAADLETYAEALAALED